MSSRSRFTPGQAVDLAQTESSELHEKFVQQPTDRVDLILEPMIRIEHMEGCRVLTGPPHARVHGDDVVAPTVNDDRRAKPGM